MHEAVAVLLPKITDTERFTVRYSGLSHEIGKLGVKVGFAQTHASYNTATHQFDTLFTHDMQPVDLAYFGAAAAIRDLTMPKSDEQPLYADLFAPTVVHDPRFSAYLRDKSHMHRDLPSLFPETIVASYNELAEAVAEIPGQQVVVKPVVGMASQGIFIGNKAEYNLASEGTFLVQEYLDTTKGIDELAIDGVHNLRIISIDSEVVGAVGRVNKDESVMLSDDIYDKVYRPEELPESFEKIVKAVHGHLKKLPGSGRNVIAIDVMRGINAQGERVDVLCEVNRRPLRISQYDLLSPQRDAAGIAWISGQWDSKEASMLAESSTL